MSDKNLSEIYGEIIQEGWDGGLSVGRPPVRNIKAAQESPMSISYKGNRIGGPEHNLAQLSMASGNNPFEQEEDYGNISKVKVFEVIDRLIGELDSTSHTDKVALMMLGKLKKIIS